MVYLPPRTDITIHNKHIDVIDNLMYHNSNSKFLVLGDFIIKPYV